jgi:hypothetical protein
MLMDIFHAFLITVLFIIGIYTVLRLIDRLCPEIIVALLLPFIVDIGIGIGNSILSVLEDAERDYPRYVYKKYCIYRIKKKFGLIPKSERFVWNDNIEEERTAETFRFVMGDPNGKALQT